MQKIFLQTVDIEGEKVLIEVKSFMIVDEENNIINVPVEQIKATEFQDNPERLMRTF